MRSTVPILVISSLTHANQKYRKNLVAYIFLHPYRTNFVKTKVLFPLFWTKLWALVSSQRPSPPVKLQKFRMQYKIVSLKVKISWFSKCVCLAYSRILDKHIKRWNMKTVWQAVSSSHSYNAYSYSCFKSQYNPCLCGSGPAELQNHTTFYLRKRNCGI